MFLCKIQFELSGFKKIFGMFLAKLKLWPQVIMESLFDVEELQ